MPYGHNSESAQKILWIQLKIGNGHLGKLAIVMLDSSMMKKMAAYSKANSKKHVSARWLLG